MDGDGRAIPLNYLRGYQIASGAPEMRGWDVYSADRRRIGCVDDVLVDTGAMQVRYLDVEVENLVATGRERHVLFPVGCARLDPELRRAVVIEGLAARAVEELPSYTRGAAVRDGDPAIAPHPDGTDQGAGRQSPELRTRMERPAVVRPIRLAPAAALALAAGDRAAAPA
jgi:photosynthetic reaction center H subunit